ncbi:protein Skeletor, isoforms B/C [Lingula anatina]|uniref:Protein Skeletor, isoforms B/C n=1 Tax=Lingula anatina TaxID=7574 RepID=A0A1S3HK20_LINAN|nr:protein Skeletor, isoforms B/C [Lingula anatina]|eukprot:XP_013385801.1 protein Skeletor, isoforms B/C [Lingula anatina]
MYAQLAAAVFLSTVALATSYQGKLIGSLSELAHQVRGTVYAVDEKRLRITGFNYDGKGPDAYFYIGLHTNPSATPDSQGIKIPDEKGSPGILSAYNNADIILTLPSGYTLQQIKWLSVWCVQFAADFGHVIFPANFVPPRPTNIGEFSRFQHGLRSGDITVLDAKTFLIPALHYDGLGPAAFFWVGTGPRPDSTGLKVPDEDGSLTRLKRYTGETIQIRLPGDLTVFDINWLSMWCIDFNANFGHVLIPANLNVPPYIADQGMSSMNCEPLTEKFHVAWAVNVSHITLELTGIIADEDYMAFGLSGSDTGTQMIGADVTVAWYDSQTGPRAVDYYMSAKSQCSNGVGVCPDIENSTPGTESVNDVSGDQMNGITRIRFTRPLNTGEATDKPIRLDREMYLAWAIGPINPDKRAAYHTVRTTGSQKLQFGRNTRYNCPTLTNKGSNEGKAPWTVKKLSGADGKVFTVRIGPAGSDRGYKAITGRTSWGIALYINDSIIPELTLKRGENYTFLVESGDSDANQAKYHPFYITDDSSGGYSQYTTPAQREAVKIFPGRNESQHPVDYQVGRLCEWEVTSNTNIDAATFDEFFKGLRLRCSVNGTVGVFHWTPDKNTPDTVYYQCYTHRFLGWKIHVVDDYPTTTAGSSSVAAGYYCILGLLLFFLGFQCW